MIGAMECRALNSSMSSIAVGLPVGEPETDFWPAIKLKAGICSGSRTAPTLWRRPFGARVSLSRRSFDRLRRVVEDFAGLLN